ncbi:MAG TPA: heme ABC exporter ATP-binding protein CcmA [Nitrospiria bacterium]|nr:heme ABC exporter ATP-binding protein CcmA [Nitrospiria bacterium]
MSIKADNLSKNYLHFRVLVKLSFEIREGTCFALFGPNGAGKTTLLRILATLLRPTEGSFELLGMDGVRDKAKIRESLFLISHGSYLYDDLTAIENLHFTLSVRGADISPQKIKSSLDRVGIGAFGNLKSRYLSAGMKKRLSIAKALLINPKILLMDEGYASLDEKGVGMLNGCIREMTRNGTTVFMTTHERYRAAEVADRASILINGALQDLPLEKLAGTDAIF